jgi:hypothetical protein
MMKKINLKEVSGGTISLGDLNTPKDVVILNNSEDNIVKKTELFSDLHMRIG